MDVLHTASGTGTNETLVAPASAHIFAATAIFLAQSHGQSIFTLAISIH